MICSPTQSSTEQFSSAINSIKCLINDTDKDNYKAKESQRTNDIPKQINSPVVPMNPLLQHINSSNKSDSWEQEFDPILNSYITSVFRQSKEEIETLNEIVSELKKIKNTPDHFNEELDDRVVKNEEDFIEQFNNRFNLSTSSLDEILNIIGTMQAERQNQPIKHSNIRRPISNNHKASKSNNKKLSKRQSSEADSISDSQSRKNQSIESSLSSNQYSNDSTDLPHIHSSEIKYLKERIQKLENENRRIKNINKRQENQISTLASQIEKNSDTRHRLMHAYTLIEGMLKENAETIYALSQQRGALITLVNKQSILLKEMDDYSVKIKDEFMVEKLSHGKELFLNQSKLMNTKDQLNSDLSSLQANFYKILPQTIKSKLNESIRNCPTVFSKLDESISFICKELKEQFNENQKNQTKLNELSKKDESSSLKISKLLSFLENDLLFLKKLTETSDLQNIIFYRPQLDHPLLLESETRHYIVQRCISTRKFIEENIGFYPKSETIKMMRPFTDSPEPDFIFNLYNTENFSNQMKKLLSFIPKNCSESTIFYDILFTQSIMNNILQNHVSALQTQIQYGNKQTQVLENTIKDKDEIMNRNEELYETNEKLQKNCEDAKRCIKILQNKEKKICETILNAFPDLSESTISASSCSYDSTLSQKVDVIDNLYYLIKTMVDRYKSQSASIDKTNSEFEAKLNDVSAHFNRKMDKKDEIIQKQKSQMFNLCKEIEKSRNQRSLCNKVIRTLLNNVKVLNNNKNQIKQDVINMKNQLSMAFKQFSEFVNKLREFNYHQRIFNKAQQEKIAELLNEKDANKIEIDQSNAKLDNKIQQCQKANKKLIQQIKSTKNQLEKSKSQIGSLKTQLESYQSKINDLDLENNEDQKVIEQLKSKISCLENSNKANEIKLNVFNENSKREKEDIKNKHDLCMNSISSDYQNKLNGEVSKNMHLNQMIFDLSTRYLDINSMEGINSEILLKSIDKYIENLLNQLTKLNIIEKDSNSCKELLSISKDEDLIEKISEMVSDLNEKENDIDCLKTELIALNDKMCLIKSENDVLKNFEKSLKQWERWARRVLSISSSAACATFTSEKLQNSLEEIILSLLNKKSIIVKLETLRAEKKCFLKFPKSFLIEKNVYAPNQNVALKTFRAMILVHIGISRIQKAAGCLPLGYNHDTMKKIIDNDIHLNY